MSAANVSAPTIFGGAPDGEERAVVALRLGAQGPYDICSGSLIAPNVVLTARHCVSRMVSDRVICTDRGTSANGDHVGVDFALDEIAVFAGEEPRFDGAPSARAASVVHRGGASLCNGDIALVVLDRPLMTASPLRVRFKSGVRAYDRVRAVGYGRSSSSLPLGRRLRRDDVDVLAVGARLTASATALGDKEFEVGRSICQGDSGGPSIDLSTGAVVGVVSRGADCRQDYGHVFTQTTGFENLFGLALQRAGATLITEDGEMLGASDLGVGDAPAGADEGGCSVSGGASAPASSLAAMTLASAALLLVRRSRRR